MSTAKPPPPHLTSIGQYLKLFWLVNAPYQGYESIFRPLRILLDSWIPFVTSPTGGVE